MEAVGAAASILAIAGAGIQISLKLIAFADRVGTAPKRIQDVGTDVSVTAGTLQELGELMKNTVPTKKSVGMFKDDQVENIKASSTRCEGIFNELKDILGKASQQLRDVDKSTTKTHDAFPKIKLSRLERMKWPFLQPGMESLRSALRDAKGTLTLILQLVHLRHAHMTASLDREEQSDLVRMIAAMKRQQFTSAYGGAGGHRAPVAIESEASDSESRDSSEIQMILEAWSATPNTLSDGAFENFLLTPIPVSQQQIAKALNTSPQTLREIASTVDSLSSPERDAILGRVLGNCRSTFYSDDSTIRSISSQSWTGSHDLFGKVTSRKFTLVIERRVGIPKSSRSNIRNISTGSIHGHRKMDTEYRHVPDSNSPIYDSFSDSDGIHEKRTYGHVSDHPPAFKMHRRRRPAQAPPMPSFERRRPFSEKERKQDVDEARRKEHEVEKKKTGHGHGRGNHDSQRWTEPRLASEPSDDDLVKSLLAEYTNFELGEPLVQVFATPPPTYDETFVIPKRAPRPY